MKTVRIAVISMVQLVYGCGNVTVETDLGASVDGGVSVKLDKPDTADTRHRPNTDVPAESMPTETHQPVDAGASLPTCPPEILHYDCPQPACDCKDR